MRKAGRVPTDAVITTLFSFAYEAWEGRNKLAATAVPVTCLPFAALGKAENLQQLMGQFAGQFSGAFRLRLFTSSFIP